MFAVPTVVAACCSRIGVAWPYFDPLVAVAFLGAVPAAMVVHTAAHFLQIAACCFQTVACCCYLAACHIAVVQTYADCSTAVVAGEAVGPGIAPGSDLCLSFQRCWA